MEFERREPESEPRESVEQYGVPLRRLELAGDAHHDGVVGEPQSAAELSRTPRVVDRRVLGDVDHLDVMGLEPGKFLQHFAFHLIPHRDRSREAARVEEPVDWIVIEVAREPDMADDGHSQETTRHGARAHVARDVHRQTVGRSTAGHAVRVEDAERRRAGPRRVR